MFSKKYFFVFLFLAGFFLAGCSRTPVVQENASEGSISRVLSGVSMNEAALTEGGGESKGPVHLEVISFDQAESIKKAIDGFTEKTTGLETKIKEWEDKEKTLLESEGSAKETETVTEVKDLKASEKETQCKDSSGTWDKDKEKCKCSDSKELKDDKCVEKVASKEKKTIADNAAIAEEAVLKTSKEKITKELKSRRDELEKITKEITEAGLKEETLNVLNKKKEGLTSSLDVIEARLDKASKEKDVSAIQKELSEILFFSRGLSQFYCSFLIYWGKGLIENKITPGLLEVEEKIAGNKELETDVSRDEEALAEARQKLIATGESLNEVENILKTEKTLEDFSKIKSEFKLVGDNLGGVKEKLTALVGVLSNKQSTATANTSGSPPVEGGPMQAGDQAATPDTVGSSAGMENPSSQAIDQKTERTPVTTDPSQEESSSQQLD
jgi:hypothetical protein